MGKATVAESGKNSHRHDFTPGTQGGVKREIWSTSHGKAARSIPWVPLGATYHTKWLKLLTYAKQSSKQLCLCCQQNRSHNLLICWWNTYFYKQQTHSKTKVEETISMKRISTSFPQTYLVHRLFWGSSRCRSPASEFAVPWWSNCFLRSRQKLQKKKKKTDAHMSD